MTTAKKAVRKPTAKQALTTKYLAACKHFDVAPDCMYKRWTIKQLDKQVTWFETKYRVNKVAGAATSAAKNTASAASTVVQSANETRKEVFARAKALVKKANLPSVRIAFK